MIPGFILEFDSFSRLRRDSAKFTCDMILEILVLQLNTTDHIWLEELKNDQICGILDSNNYSNAQILLYEQGKKAHYAIILSYISF